MTSRWNISAIPLGGRIYAVSGVGTLIALTAYSVYGAVYNYFDIAAFVMLLASVLLCMADMVFHEKVTLAGMAKLFSVFLTAGAFALFFYNSYPVWADELNNITMYSSRGGLTPVIILCVLFVLDLLGLVTSCFFSDEGGNV